MSPKVWLWAPKPPSYVGWLGQALSYVSVRPLARVGTLLRYGGSGTLGLSYVSPKVWLWAPKPPSYVGWGGRTLSYVSVRPTGMVRSMGLMCWARGWTSPRLLVAIG